MNHSHQNHVERCVRRMADERGIASPLVFLLVALIVACVGVGVAGSRYLINTYTQIKDVENAYDIVPELPESAGEDAQKQQGEDTQTGKIDFEALRKENPDIYAWIYIPDTHVNYPVCQNAKSNEYYLTHGPNGKESDVGAIFSEAQFNHPNFDDQVTVLYGHNGYADTMFSDLHEYGTHDYFDAHDKVYIFTPDGVQTYQVFSAFSAGERHIMDAFDFQTEDGYNAFLDYLVAPEAIDAQIKDITISSNDKILILSTCTTGVIESQGRYLVCGVLVDERSA